MKKFFTLWMLCLVASIEVTAQVGGITGKVVDEKKEPLVGAFVEVMQDGIKKTETVTDEDGYYILKPLTPGRYDVTVKYVGYKESKTESVIVSPDRNTTLNIRMEPLPDTSGFTKEGYKACGGGRGHWMPLVPEKTITAADIEKMPTRRTIILSLPQDGSIRCIVFDSKNEHYITNASILVKNKNIEVANVSLNESGTYNIKSLKPGKYNIVVKSESYQTKKIKDVVVYPGINTNLYVTIYPRKLFNKKTTVHYKIPKLELNNQNQLVPAETVY